MIKTTNYEDDFWSTGNFIKKVLIGFGILVCAVIILSLVSSFWQEIPAGSVGIMDTFGKVSPTTYNSGLVFPKNPFARFNIYNMRMQKLNIENLEASDKEGQLVYADIVINFKIKDNNSARRILLEIGKPSDYVDIMALKEKTTQGFKQTTVGYEAMEILKKRQEVSDKARDNIFNRLPTDLLDVESINIVDIRFTKAFDDAIERKKVAEQSALASENEVKVAEAEAKKSIAQAEGEKKVTILNAEAQAEQKLVIAKAEAESLRLQKEEITPLILQLRQIEAQVKAYEKWNGQLPTIISGQGSIPFINMNFDSQQSKVSSGG
jgi:regulator of protease activity HflC (stomatin/prohibitin superfamily)